jgi:hypothetical protein
MECMEKRYANRVLLINPEGKESFERPKHRWEDGIVMDVKGIGWG